MNRNSYWNKPSTPVEEIKGTPVKVNWGTCSLCGSHDYEDVSIQMTAENDGYSNCCNEPVNR